MKKYINGLCYFGDKIQYNDGVKYIISKNIEFSYDEESDRFIELSKSIIPIMDILYSNLNEDTEKEYFEKFREIGISYRNNNDSGIFVDEDSIVLSSNEKIYLNYLVKEGLLKVPLLMFPDKEDWESLGFVFNKANNKEQDYYYVQIPDKWSIEINERCGVFSIIDNKGRARGYINPNSYNSYGEPFMRLFSRYHFYRYINDNKEILYFGEKDRPLFISDVITKDNKLYSYVRLVEKANKEYPDWRNPIAYWDRKKSRKLTRNS